MGKEQIKYKSFDFEVRNTKEIERDGQKFGIVEGYASTYGNIDRDGDRITHGAFKNTLEDHKERNRPVRMLWQHIRNEMIGGFPIDKIKEDEKGLFVVGEINLEVQRGREAYALAKQGVLTDFSIGYSVVKFSQNNDEDENVIWNLDELKLWEVSLVGEPANQEATVTDVKTLVLFQDLPLADRARAWDRSVAEKRVRAWAGAEDAPNVRYRRAFVWYDRENQENFGAYKLMIADIVNGRLVAVPRAIFAAAGALQGARGGVNIPDTDKQKARNHLSKYYKKMDLTPPWNKSLDSIEDLKGLEEYLKVYGISNTDCKTIVSKIKHFVKQSDSVNDKGNAQSDSGADEKANMKEALDNCIQIIGGLNNE